jgi:acyl-CoA thioesterase
MRERHESSVVSTPETGIHPAVTRAAEAAATARPEFGSFFLARFLDLRISYDDETRTCTLGGWQPAELAEPAGRVRQVLPYAAHLTNPQGSVHGGILTTAMDISMGHLCHRFLSTAVTVEMDLRFLRPLTGTGTCRAALLRAGRRIVHLESRLTDEHDRLVALATGSWHRLDADTRTPAMS